MDGHRSSRGLRCIAPSGVSGQRPKKSNHFSKKNKMELEQRNIYLGLKPLAEAQKLALDLARDYVRRTETVPVVDALGRILAGPVFASVSSPNYQAAAMDGVALDARVTFGASEMNPVMLTIGRDAFWVNTGNAIPYGTNAVVMIENVVDIGDDHIQLEAAASPWQHVRNIGEDIVATEMLFPRNQVISPYCIAALLAGGVTSVEVVARPTVLIIPTGDELVDAEQLGARPLESGEILETNSWMLGKMAEECGTTFVRYARVADNLHNISRALETAAKEYDVVMLLSGSSAGSEDYALQAMQSVGEVLTHGVAMMPGKPVVMARINGKPAFGMPGYPVSAALVFTEIVAPMLSAMSGKPMPEPVEIPVHPLRKISSRLGIEEFMRVKLGIINDKVVAVPLPRGAGSITSMTRADGIIRVPANQDGLLENETVTARLLVPKADIRKTIMVTGSHDNLLDLLSDFMRGLYGDITLSSSHVGSLGGLVALSKGECHVAGSHLLDAADGSYNQSYVKKFVNIPVQAYNLAWREQGLIVAKGNPQGIRSIEDLKRTDVEFINRQPGSGTRVLLDYHLEQCGIKPAEIPGYYHEEFTHMAVAAAVKGGASDAGMGIFAAAKALDLDFVPIATERYDLIIAESSLQQENIVKLLETLQNPEFKQLVNSFGGYDSRQTGERMF